MGDENHTLDTLEWPENVFIFSNETHTSEQIKEIVRETEDPLVDYEFQGRPAKTYTSGKHFSTKHYALLFAPGTYVDCDFEIGYYVQVAGLGKNASDVKFTASTHTSRTGPFVDALNKNLDYVEGGTIEWPGSGLTLDTFWRAAENFSVHAKEGLTWAVSQAAPLRRVKVTGGDLKLIDSGYASGGFVANAHVEKQVRLGGQQQYFLRNIQLDGNHPETEIDWQGNVVPSHTIMGGAWSLVFSGCSGKGVPKPDPGTVTRRSVSVEHVPKIRVEKPFIVLDNKEWQLHVPKPIFDANVIGPQLDSSPSHTDIRSFANVKVVASRAAKDPDNIHEYNTTDIIDILKTSEMQLALDEGKDLVLCPGEFFLTKTLVVRNPNQVILGLGLATLVAPKDGTPCIQVKSDTPGVRIAGIMMEASVLDHTLVDGPKSFLEVGDVGGDKNNNESKENPVVITDIFCRIGGSNLDRSVSTDVIIRIHSDHVVGDNLWLWRADHVMLAPNEEPNDERFKLYHQVRQDECKVDVAIIVYGNHVKMYGLFCEHTLKDQCIWKGNHGSTTFFQCELPYDVSESYGEEGYAGYVVDPLVDHHEGMGIGIYSNFTQYDVKVPSAIIHPECKDGVRFQNVFTRFLQDKGEITTVKNGLGEAVDADFQGPSRLKH